MRIRLGIVWILLICGCFVFGAVKLIEERQNKRKETEYLYKILSNLQAENDALASRLDNYIDIGIKHITVEATAYLCKDELEGRHHGITASGAHCRPSVSVAVDPNIIPLGSLIRVNDRWMIAQDTGNLIKGNKIDVAVFSRQEAELFGRQAMDVIILENGI